MKPILKTFAVATALCCSVCFSSPLTEVPEEAALRLFVEAGNFMRKESSSPLSRVVGAVAYFLSPNVKTTISNNGDSFYDGSDSKETPFFGHSASYHGYSTSTSNEACLP